MAPDIAAWGLLYAPSHRHDTTYHGLCTPVMEHWLEQLNKNGFKNTKLSQTLTKQTQEDKSLLKNKKEITYLSCNDSLIAY